MRPSSISFVSVILATSRRIPSNDERTTAPGVSSMMMSTPVRCSSALMLRPSRPMIRPFMSSDGSSTSDTVVSAAWLAATRCSASATRLRARRRASDCASSSICRTRRASSWRTSSSERCRTSACASLTVIAGDALQLDELLVLGRLQLLLELAGVHLAVGDSLFAPVELGRPPFEIALRAPPGAPASGATRTAASSPPARRSSRSRTDSSFASSWASRRRASASRRASCEQQLPGPPCRCEPRSPAERQAATAASAAPTTRPMMMPITIAMPLLGRRSCGGRRRAPSAAEPARTHPANRSKRTATARVARY